MACLIIHLLSIQPIYLKYFAPNLQPVFAILITTPIPFLLVVVRNWDSIRVEYIYLVGRDNQMQVGASTIYQLDALHVIIINEDWIRAIHGTRTAHDVFLGRNLC